MALQHGGWMAALLAACIGCCGAVRAAPLRLAVVGDSDSHAYQDGTRFTGKDGRRGGDFHETTWQWTEWLQRLRGGEVDQGPWGRYGSRRIVALIEEAVGRPRRIPEKEAARTNVCAVFILEWHNQISWQRTGSTI